MWAHIYKNGIIAVSVSGIVFICCLLDEWIHKSCITCILYSINYLSLISDFFYNISLFSASQLSCAAGNIYISIFIMQESRLKSLVTRLSSYNNLMAGVRSNVLTLSMLCFPHCIKNTHLSDNYIIKILVPIGSVKRCMRE